MTEDRRATQRRDPKKIDWKREDFEAALVTAARELIDYSGAEKFFQSLGAGMGVYIGKDAATLPIGALAADIMDLRLNWQGDPAEEAAAARGHAQACKQAAALVGGAAASNDKKSPYVYGDDQNAASEVGNIADLERVTSRSLLDLATLFQVSMQTNTAVLVHPESARQLFEAMTTGRAADAPSEPSDQTALLKLLRRLLDGSQPKDVMGAVMVIDSALGGKQAWEYSITPPDAFSEYVAKNYSGDVNFHDPEWHAKRLWNAAMRSITGKSRAADAPSALPTRAQLEAIDRAMNHMGDTLNEYDMCDESDEEVTAAGFAAIKRLLSDVAADALDSQPTEQSGEAVAYRVRLTNNDKIKTWIFESYDDAFEFWMSQGGVLDQLYDTPQAASQPPAAASIGDDALITQSAKDIAQKVAKNAGVVPEVCFPHIYLGLLDYERIRAPAAAAASVPDGWKLVPVEPTSKMLRAAFRLDLSYMPGQENADRAAVYDAMLAAAPQQEGSEAGNGN